MQFHPSEARRRLLLTLMKSPSPLPPASAGYPLFLRVSHPPPLASKAPTPNPQASAASPPARVDLQFEFRGIRMADYGKAY
jgi:hypothetical protein